MRKLSAIIALELYALLLAVFQYSVGVRTDEAKYLLNIPYPHPPFVRFVLSSTEWLPFQELFWRIIFATLLIQSVWLFWSFSSSLSVRQRAALFVAWNFSAAVIFQAGTVMMAPLTAVQALVFVWFYFRFKDNTSTIWLLGLFWLVSLFTAYQALLYAPLVLHIFWKTKASFSLKIAIFSIPVALLALYSFTNPLALASMVNVAGKDGAESFLFRITDTGKLLLLAGSFTGSVLGTIGLLKKPHFGLLASFILVLFYVLLGRYSYYAILFTPLLMAGLFMLIDRRSVQSLMFVGMPLGACCCLAFWPPQTEPSLARQVMNQVDLSGHTRVMMVGTFGHEWQYQSTVPVLRYTSQPTETDLIVCLEDCTDIEEETGFQKQSLFGVAVVRSQF